MHESRIPGNSLFATVTPDLSPTGERVRVNAVELSFFGPFLLYVLSDRFMRIRHYGFLANPCKKQDLSRSRQLIGPSLPKPERVRDVRNKEDIDMIELPYSLVIEATDEPDYFGFYSPDLEGFSGIGHSVMV